MSAIGTGRSRLTCMIFQIAWRRQTTVKTKINKSSEPKRKNQKSKPRRNKRTSLSRYKKRVSDSPNCLTPIADQARPQQFDCFLFGFKNVHLCKNLQFHERKSLSDQNARLEVEWRSTQVTSSPLVIKLVIKTLSSLGH